MPKATVDTNPIKYDLKTLPEGFVEIKRMPYAAWLHRQDIAMNMQMKGAGKKGGNTESTMDIKMANQATTMYEFQHCIVNHNLEDANGHPLDFSGVQALATLDPRIGSEIAGYIMELHEFETGNSNSESTPALF